VKAGVARRFDGALNEEEMTPSFRLREQFGLAAMAPLFERLEMLTGISVFLCELFV
jgi:hypothetical protein